MSFMRIVKKIVAKQVDRKNGFMVKPDTTELHAAYAEMKAEGKDPWPTQTPEPTGLRHYSKTRLIE